MIKLTHAKRGFTLIELMMTVAIIGILAAVAYPNYMEYVRKAKRAEAQAALMQILQRQERIYSQQYTYIAFATGSSSATSLNIKTYSGESATSSAYELSGAACDNLTIRDCIQITAQPGTANVGKFSDPDCGTLSITSTGVKNASGTKGLKCWD